MKTPREVLFARHRHAEPKLDAVRQKIIAALRDADAEAARAPPPARTKSFQVVLRKVWLELIWPSRRAWAGLAALWLILFAANIEMKATSPAVTRVRPVPAREIVRGFEEQRRLLAELLPPTAPAPVSEALPNSGPRSERILPFRRC